MSLGLNETVELTIEKPAAGGAMIARAGGQVVLVTGAIPGERVAARVERVSKSVVFARTIAVKDASPDRRDSTADPLCGGCLYSHIAYPRQLEIKSDVITDAFGRIGHITLPSRVSVRASSEVGYRMRARLHVRDGRLGFFREGTHEVCDVRRTGQLLTSTCDTLDRVAAAVRSLGGGTVREIELSENLDATQRVVSLDTSAPLDRKTLDAMTTIEGLTPPPYVTDELEIGGRHFSLRRHVLAFFQGNRYLLRDLVAHVAERVQPGSAVADLYAGVGLFAVGVSVLRDATVVAIEGDRYAADDLATNSVTSSERIRAIRGDVESMAASLARPDVVIVDPPRTGMSRAALDGVLRLKAGKLMYVSCDVATLARDSRRIMDAGYTIERADAFDMFPNTPHVETVVAFERSA